MKGDYRFYFSEPGNRLDIRVNILKCGQAVFMSRLSGKEIPLTSRNVLRTLGSFPFTAHLAMPRIVWEAAKLRCQKGLKVYTKPIASSEMTIRTAQPSLVQKASTSIGFWFLSKIRRGCLTLEFPDGSLRKFGTPERNLDAVLRVRNYDFFVKSLFSGDVGFGEAYVDGYWDSDDLCKMLKLFIYNEEYLDERSLQVSRIGEFFDRLFHLYRSNTFRGSAKNIQAHYDMSNELFASFLDESMSYSCGLYQSPNDTLADAQQNKITAMIEKARIGADDHVLEIGSGWGSLAIEAAQRTGCRVTSITLSEEQLKYARERAAAAGLEDRVTFQLCDYRSMSGSFDKILSVEMLEAVGHKFLGTFFSTCDSLLKPHGLLALQVITMPDQHYNYYRRSCDWIQKYIFPGGLCPSLTAISAAMTKHSSFVVENADNIGVHYAKTLSDWRNRFLDNFPKIDALGFDERFKRIWIYYLCYCEAGFAARKLNTLQLVLTRAKNSSLPLAPGYGGA
jgi:cyclopropane-fatty-acyl-phospholipid synthase